jgi:Carboxypeptidase regulatory-like domain/TonB-dependent Receptor Plug Domain
MPPRAQTIVGPLLLVAASRLASGQSVPMRGEIHGIVVDTAGRPLTGVNVFDLTGAWRVVTPVNGQFRVASVPPGEHRIVARRPGFKPDTLGLILVAGDTAAIRFALGAAVVTLPDVLVSGDGDSPRLAGFERRRQGGNGGRYITRAEIEAQSPTETTDLLRRVMGIQIADSNGVAVVISARGGKVVLNGRQRVTVPCLLRLGVDGFMKDPGFTINSIPPAEIHGIEIYEGPASIPLQFNESRRTDAYCGLIMIWTRSR